MKNMRNRIIVLIAAILVVVAAGVVALQYSNPNATNSHKLQVVAGENFWGNITSQIGGDHVNVTSIISDPSVDPHLYASNAHDSAALASASLVIKNGLGYDDFIDKLMAAAPNDTRQVLSIDNVLRISGDNPNPHLWYDIPKVSQAADAIEKALAAIDSANTNVYAANLATFKISLQPITDVINQIKTKYPGAPVAYTERVPGYLLEAAGLKVASPASFASAIEEGNDPSPADTAIMEALMTNHGVRVLLYNSQAISSVTQHVQDLAKQSGIPVVGVTETIPTAEKTYQSWQLDQAKALLTALGG